MQWKWQTLHARGYTMNTVCYERKFENHIAWLKQLPEESVLFTQGYATGISQIERGNSTRGTSWKQFHVFLNLGTSQRAFVFGLKRFVVGYVSGQKEAEAAHDLAAMALQIEVPLFSAISRDALMNGELDTKDHPYGIVAVENFKLRIKEPARSGMRQICKILEASAPRGGTGPQLPPYDRLAQGRPAKRIKVSP